MSEKYYQEQGIDKSLTKKEVLKAFIVSVFICGMATLIASAVIWGTFNDPENNPWVIFGITLLYIYIPIVIIIVALVAVTGPVVVSIISWIYTKKYVKSFTYKLTSSHLEIKQGVFTKNKVTIPYSRVQNINIVNGIFDRIYNIYTVLIETAGISGVQAQGGNIGRPEGYIPGLKDPYAFEAELKQMLDKYSVLPSGLEEKVFKPQELAFDNFISYIISKIRDKDDLLKTNIKELREKQNLTLADLAAKVGVKNQTIELLEAGRYTPSLSLAYKIARELNSKIEDLFKFD
ncbi:MAG: PH domain-containing protein [Promethearchaeota archaeon]